MPASSHRAAGPVDVHWTRTCYYIILCLLIRTGLCVCVCVCVMCECGQPVVFHVRIWNVSPCRVGLSAESLIDYRFSWFFLIYLFIDRLFFANSTLDHYLYDIRTIRQYAVGNSCKHHNITVRRVWMSHVRTIYNIICTSLYVLYWYNI